MFPGFTPTNDHNHCHQLLDEAMRELGRRRDLLARLRIEAEPARKVRGPATSSRNVFTYWSVFGFRGRSGGFNETPHLTLGVGSDTDVSAMVTLPNKASGGVWTHLRDSNLAFLMSAVLRDMASATSNCPGMEPRLRLRQRHWLTRRGPSFQDAYLDVDLRTLKGDPKSGVKKQPEWIEAAHRIIQNRHSNLELQVGATFPYKTCEPIRTARALDHVAAAWIACGSFIRVLRRRA